MAALDMPELPVGEGPQPVGLAEPAGVQVRQHVQRQIDAAPPP